MPPLERESVAVARLHRLDRRIALVRGALLVGAALLVAWLLSLSIGIHILSGKLRVQPAYGATIAFAIWAAATGLSGYLWRLRSRRRACRAELSSLAGYPGADLRAVVQRLEARVAELEAVVADGAR